MIEKVRRAGRTKSIFATVVFGAICLVFVFFGVTPDQFGIQSGGAAAEVNGAIVSYAEFVQNLRQAEERMRERLDQLPEAQRLQEQSRLRQQVLEQLIAVELISQKAQDYGLRVSDPEVMQTIVDIPVFQEEGRFRRERYDSYLQYTRQSPADFEEDTRKRLAFQRLQQLFNIAVRPIPGELDIQREVQSAQVNIDWAHFTKAQLLEAIPVASVEVDELLASEEGLAEVKKSYEANLSKYSQKEQVKARHILISAGEGESDEKTLLAKVDELKTELKPQNFAQMAKEHSEDPGSKGKGGDLGYFGRGQMTPEFEKAAFNLPVGEVSPPIKSPFGYHFILVEDKKEASTKAFEEVQKLEARRVLADKKVEGVLEKIKEQASTGNIQQLNASLKELKLDWSKDQSLGLGRAQLPQVGEASKVIDRLIESGMEPGVLEDLLEINGNYVLVKLNEFQKSSNDPMQNFPQGAWMERMYSMQRANPLFDAWYKNLLENANIKRSERALNSEVL